jgi:hypothetical protein
VAALPLKISLAIWKDEEGFATRGGGPNDFIFEWAF